MRTKHLLYTMALASIFAACTQDEFETVNGADALAGRKSIGKVTFTEAPSTRWDVNNFNSILPEAGDGYSLLLVDVPRQGLDGQHVYPIDNYELVSDVQTNYVFKTTDGVHFNNDAELVEGNYLFVAPAQEGKLDRKTVEITLPTEQNLSLGADGKLDPLSAIKEFAKSGYPFYIGHRFLSEGGTVSQPRMLNLFAFPEITITNTVRNAEHTPVLKQVILKRPQADKPFVINATLDTKKAAKALTNEWFGAAGDDTKDQMVVGDWAGHMVEYFGESNRTDQDSKTDGTAVEIPSTVDYEVTYLDGSDSKYYMYNNGLYGATSSIISNPQSTSQYIVINMPGDGIELGYEEEVTFNAIIPAENYVLGGRNDKNADLEVYAVFGHDEAWQKVMQSNTNVTMYPGKRYPEQDYTGLKVKGEVGKYFTLDINPNTTDGQAKCVSVSAAEILGTLTTVKTTQELLAAVQNAPSNEVLTVTVEGRNVVYNSEINNALARTQCQNLNIEGYIKVEGTNDEQNPLIVDPRVNMEQVVIEKGYVQAGAASLENVFVAKGGALNLTETAEGNAVIDNAGTLTLSTAKFAKVNNYNVLKVNYNLSNVATNYDREAVSGIANLYAACGEGGEIISPSIDLEPSVEVMAGGMYKISGNLNYEITVDAGTKADNSDAGQLLLNDDTNIVTEEQQFNNKTVERIGNIINNGKVTGAGVLTVYPGLSMNVGTKATVENKVVISPATVKLENMTSGVAEYKPKAVVYNAGTLAGDVDVNGLLVMENTNARVKGNVGFTAKGNDKGEIDNSKQGVIEKKISDDGVVVFATIDKIDLDDHANTVIALKKFTNATSQVRVFRLTGDMIRTESDCEFNKGHLGGNEVTIEFMAGSSIKLGECTLTSDLKFVARAKDILVNGRTTGTSKLSATTEKGYRYLGFNEGKYWSEQGNFKANNSTIQ